MGASPPTPSAMKHSRRACKLPSMPPDLSEPLRHESRLCTRSQRSRGRHLTRVSESVVNAGLKLPENQRFEIVGFFALLGRILWFDPRREYSSIPTANSRSRRAQGLSRLAASSRPPAGLGLDWPEHGGILNRIGAGGAHHIIGKFKPLVLGEIHAAGDTSKKARLLRRV